MLLRGANGDEGGEEVLPDGVLTGTVSAYGTPYNVGRGLKESITTGAFNDSLRACGGILPVFYQHDWDNPIGDASTSDLESRLNVEATLYIAENERARSVYRGAQSRALRDWSIGFIPTVLRMDTDDRSLEHVDAGDLLEVSVVVRGANPDAKMISVRNFGLDLDPEEVEEEIHKNGLPDPLIAWDHMAEAHYRDALRSVMVQLDSRETQQGA